MIFSQLGGLFPRWTAALAYGDASPLLARVLRALEWPVDGWADALVAHLGQRAFFPPLGLPRLAWSIPADGSPPGTLTLAVGVERVPIAPAASAYHFVTEPGPSWFADPELPGRLFLRDLARVEATGEVVGGVWSVPAGDALVPGEDLWWAGGGDFTRLAAERFDPAAGTVTLPATGSVTVRYASARRRAALATATVLAAAAPPRTPRPLDLWNAWDEIGLAVDLPRFPGEDNPAYADRLLGVYPSPGGPTRSGLRRGVARRLALLTQAGLDPAAPPAVPGGTTDLWVVGVDETTAEPHAPLAPGADGLWYADRAGWARDATIFVGGRALAPSGTADGQPLPGAPAPDLVFARLRYHPYAVTRDPDGDPTALTIDALPPAPGHRLAAVAGLRVWGAGDRLFAARRLLDGAGLPTPYFDALVPLLRREMAVTLGDVTWRRAAWLPGPGTPGPLGPGTPGPLGPGDPAGSDGPGARGSDTRPAAGYAPLGMDR